MDFLGWVKFFLFGWGLPFSLYVLVQAWTLKVTKGKLRIAAMIPVLPMLGVALYTIVAFSAHSNLWPLVMIFGSPLALVYIIIVAVTEFGKRQDREFARNGVKASQA